MSEFEEPASADTDQSAETEVVEVAAHVGEPEADPAGDGLREADDIDLADQLRQAREQILTELRKIIIGQ